MERQTVILFDGVCNLCNGAVQYIIRHDKEEHFSFASLQSGAGQRLLEQYDLPQQHFDTFVLIDQGKAWTRSTAASAVSPDDTASRMRRSQPWSWANIRNVSSTSRCSP